MNVVAVVVAGGRRPGATVDLDVLTPLAGVPILVRTVRAVLASGVADRVLLDGGVRTAEFLRACSGLAVDAWQPGRSLLHLRAHAGQRAGRTAGSPEALLVHEAARPLAPPALFTAVVEAVRAGHDAVVPVLPLADTVKVVDGAGLLRGTPDRSGLRVLQTPRAFRCDGVTEPGPLLARCGAGAHPVTGDPLAFPVRSGWDLELAQLLLEGST